MGDTILSRMQVLELIEHLKPEWSGDTYSLIRKNCINFADQFSCLLGVGSVPDWVRSLQDSAVRASYHIDSTVATVRIGWSATVRKMSGIISQRGLIVDEITKAATYSLRAISSRLPNITGVISDSNDDRDEADHDGDDKQSVDLVYNRQ